MLLSLIHISLSHLLRYSLMSNDEQVPLAREVRIVDEYYSIYHVRFGDRVKMVWRISDSLDLTETMVPSFILQPLVENAFKHGISPKEEGGVVRIRINPLRDKGLLYISVCDNGVGIQPEQLAQLKAALAQPGERWEHIGVYNAVSYTHLEPGGTGRGPRPGAAGPLSGLRLSGRVPRPVLCAGPLGHGLHRDGELRRKGGGHRRRRAAHRGAGREPHRGALPRRSEYQAVAAGGKIIRII